MDYVLAVFSVRTDTMQFSNFLTKNKINNTVVETPKGASVSCGISVKFKFADFSSVKRLLPLSGTRSFVKFYMQNNMGLISKMKY